MQESLNWKKALLFWLLLLAVPVLVLALLLPPLWRQLEDRLRPELVGWMATHLSPEERARIEANIASMATGMFHIIPDPLVGRVGRSHFKTVEKEADIALNNAGMRSQTDYGPKPVGVFRIVCLGDSFVFGAAGKEEDRFCRQIEDFYRDNGITVQGKRIETLAVGLPSWNMRQEATYLATRLDDYAPDVILMLSCQNDITDAFGITEGGSITSDYASDRRALGSGVFTSLPGDLFGGGVYGALNSDACPTCRQYWGEAFAAIGRLVELQQRRGGQTLLSGLEYPGRHAGLFTQLYLQHAQGSGAPYLLTGHKVGKAGRLPHDGHPNRYGHHLIAMHYVRALAQHGWVTVPEAQWPVEDGMHPDNNNPPPDNEALASERDTFMREHLHTRIDFTTMDKEMLPALLGGIFPEQEARLPQGEAPWASVRAGFLLQRPEATGDAKLTLVLQLPARSELYPLPLMVKVNGEILASPVIDAASAGQQQTVQATVPAALLAQYPAVEVLLETPRYFSGIEDHRMKSYRLVSATVE